MICDNCHEYYYWGEILPWSNMNQILCKDCYSKLGVSNGK